MIFLKKNDLNFPDFILLVMMIYSKF